jgi:hypothetical protein
MLFEHSRMPKGPGPPGGCGKANGEKAQPDLISSSAQSRWCPASALLPLGKEKAPPLPERTPSQGENFFAHL